MFGKLLRGVGLALAGTVMTLGGLLIGFFLGAVLDGYFLNRASIEVQAVFASVVAVIICGVFWYLAFVEIRNTKRGRQAEAGVES